MKIVFVCTGNTCRSPMAEYLLRDYCKKNNLDIQVESRGLGCINGVPISENSDIVLQELGIDASGHRSQIFVLKDLFDADLVVAMTNTHKNALIYHFNDSEKVKTFDEITHIGDINDPYGCGIGVYRLCRDKIAKGVEILVSKLQEGK